MTVRRPYIYFLFCGFFLLFSYLRFKTIRNSRRSLFFKWIIFDLCNHGSSCGWISCEHEQHSNEKKKEFSLLFYFLLQFKTPYERWCISRILLYKSLIPEKWIKQIRNNFFISRSVIIIIHGIRRNRKRKWI